MAGFKVFLSHLSVESKLAELLQGHIEQDFIGLVDVFASSDRLSIPVGTPWLDKVMKGLEDSRMHLILCSPESIKRPWIHYEAGAARLRKLPAVPLCHSELTHEQLPVPLSEGQGVQLGEAAGIKALYDALAAILGSKVPQADFEEYATEVKVFEQQIAQEREATEALGGGTADGSTIQDPRVLCVTSKQFIELGFENQIDLVLKAFPKRIQHDRLMTAEEVAKLLRTQQVDVVHIAAYVCPRTGDLYFSDVDLSSGKSASAEDDIMTADELAALLTMSHTRLVVVGTCESLVLAATLLPVAKVVATRDMVSPKMMAKWVETFYDALADQPLSAAFDLAVKASGARMRLYARTDIRVIGAATRASYAS